MAGDLQRDGVKFCRSIFDTVRKMSADGLGVTRQGYSSTESEVLDYLKMIGTDMKTFRESMRATAEKQARTEVLLAAVAGGQPRRQRAAGRQL